MPPRIVYPASRSSGYEHVIITSKYPDDPKFFDEQTIQPGNFIGQLKSIVKRSRSVHTRRNTAFSSCVSGDPRHPKHYHLFYYHQSQCAITQLIHNVFRYNIRGDGRFEHFRISWTAVRHPEAMRKYVCEGDTKTVLYDAAGGGDPSWDAEDRSIGDDDWRGREPEDVRDDADSTAGQPSSEGGGNDQDSDSDEGPRWLAKRARRSESKQKRLLRWIQTFLAPDLSIFKRAILQEEEGLEFQEDFTTKKYLEFAATQLALEQLKLKDLDYELYVGRMHPRVLALINTGMMSIEESLRWLRLIFKTSGIQEAAFTQDVFEIVNSKRPKKNSLYLCGGSNAGKSCVANSIGGGVCSVPLQNVGGKPSELKFAFAPVVNGRLCVVNECTIPTDALETWLPILGGEPVMTDVKFESMQTIPRTPLIITSNKEPGADLNPGSRQVHLPALLNRLTVYRFSTCPELAEMHGSLNPGIWPILFELHVDYSKYVPNVIIHDM